MKTVLKKKQKIISKSTKVKHAKINTIGVLTQDRIQLINKLNGKNKQKTIFQNNTNDQIFVNIPIETVLENHNSTSNKINKLTEVL